MSFKPNQAEFIFRINPPVTSVELNLLFAASWKNHSLSEFHPILLRSLSYVCAYDENRLVGFVNIAWDGGRHGFILDTTVVPEYQRRGKGQQLVKQATGVAKGFGNERLPVD